MFEKDVLEIAKDIYIHHFDDDVKYPDVLNAIITGIQRGAEFGYNKANEWHYPSKGEYPKDEKNVLCILGEFENINLEVGYYSQKENERERWRFSEYSTPDDSKNDWGVSAWKEIVLPELKESK